MSRKVSLAKTLFSVTDGYQLGKKGKSTSLLEKMGWHYRMGGRFVSFVCPPTERQARSVVQDEPRV
jgi:hypothetical protein